MSRLRPESGCHELVFETGYELDEAAEVALEDYARALTRSRGAEASRSAEKDPLVEGVHVCGLGASPSPPILRDLEDFARDLARRTSGGAGLGWS